MHRCFIDPEKWTPSTVTPSPEETHHLLDVLRLNAGDRVLAFDGAGHEAIAEVVRPEKGNDPEATRLILQIREDRLTAAPSTECFLMQAIPKGRRMDLIIEKSTELGIAGIWPVVTNRGISRPDRKQAEGKVERWRRIAQQASRQSRRAWIPDIAPIRPLAEAMEQAKNTDLFLVGSLEDDSRPLRDILRDIRQTPDDRPAKVCVLIGPEGDLTPKELEQARAAGAIPVSFGPSTLRVETAGLFAAAVLAYEFL